MRVVVERRAEERAQKYKLLHDKYQFTEEALQLGINYHYLIIIANNHTNRKENRYTKRC